MNITMESWKAGGYVRNALVRCCYLHILHFLSFQYCRTQGPWGKMTCITRRQPLLIRRASKEQTVCRDRLGLGTSADDATHLKADSTGRRSLWRNHLPRASWVTLRTTGMQIAFVSNCPGNSGMELGAAWSMQMCNHCSLEQRAVISLLHSTSDWTLITSPTPPHKLGEDSTLSKPCRHAE